MDRYNTGEAGIVTLIGRPSPTDFNDRTTPSSPPSFILDFVRPPLPDLRRRLHACIYIYIYIQVSVENGISFFFYLLFRSSTTVVKYRPTEVFDRCFHKNVWTKGGKASDTRRRGSRFFSGRVRRRAATGGDRIVSRNR